MRLTRLEESEFEQGQYRDTRQRLPLPELTPAGAEPERIRALVQRLAESRLVVITLGPVGGEVQVEISGEALICH